MKTGKVNIKHQPAAKVARNNKLHKIAIKPLLGHTVKTWDKFGQTLHMLPYFMHAKHKTFRFCLTSQYTIFSVMFG